MWLLTQLQLYKLLRRYRRDRDLDEFMNDPLLEDPLLRTAVSDIRSRLYSDENRKLKQKEAEYLALQNQINPHFLYNTLEAIRADALLADCEDIAATTEALATFYRYTISNIREVVTFSDEIDNVENYFTVQQCRFGDKIRMELDLQNEKLLEARMPKLILQPLVENAIVHGLEGKLEPGTVRIRVDNSEETLFIRVRDDGIGMSREKLLQMNRRFENTGREESTAPVSHRGGIALVNVNSRIQLVYGNSYGLRMYSVEGAGTECVLTMPLSFEG